MSKLRNLIGRKRWIIFSYVLILGGIATAGVFATTNNVAKNSAEESLLCEEEPEMATSLKKNEGTIEVSSEEPEITIFLLQKNKNGIFIPIHQQINEEDTTPLKFVVPLGHTYKVMAEKEGFLPFKSCEIRMDTYKQKEDVFLYLKKDPEALAPPDFPLEPDE